MEDITSVGSETPGGATPTPAPVEATPSTSAAPVAATPQTGTPQAPATGAPQGQEGWVPSYRLREAREAATRQAGEQYAQREAQQQARYAEMERKFNALAGITPPADPEVSQVRDQFGRLYPGLSKIEENADRLLGLMERAGDLESQNQHYWQTYGRQTVDRLFTSASTALGSPLSDEGKRALHSAFTGWVSSSPELTARYTNDPTIVDDFMRVFTSSFIDPARRAASAQVVDRTGQLLPRDTPGGAPRATPAPTLQNLDERVAAGWAMFNHNKP